MRNLTRAGLATLALAIGAFGAAGCSAHRAAVTNPCPTVMKQGTIVASSNRGAIGLAKIGLVPDALKAQQTCG